MRIYDDCAIEFCGTGLEEIIGENSLNCDDFAYTKLPTPTIHNTWTVTAANGSPYQNPSDITSTNNNHTVCYGALISFSGSYKYIVNIGNDEVEPESIAGSWGTYVYGSDVMSPLITEDGVTSYTVSLYKPMTGLIVDGAQVICADGEMDGTHASATLTFGHSYYFGYNTNPNPTENDILVMRQDDKYLSSRQQTIDGVDPTGEEYTVYAYPVEYGLLEDVILDGASAVLGAFNLQGPKNLLNHANVNVSCYVYVSNAMDAFTNNELKFL